MYYADCENVCELFRLNRRKIDEKFLLGLLIYNLSKFITAEQCRQDDFFKKYRNDYVYFEVGCYMFFRMDVWLTIEKPNERYKLSKSLVDQYIKLFSSFYPNMDFAELFNNRLSHYTEFIRKGENVEKYHTHLGHLIMNSVNGDLKIYNNPYDVPSELSGVIEKVELENNIIAFEKCMLPHAFDALETYFYNQ